jgi:peptidoglycan/LPS O-acetylase OafA/YrhL
MAKSKHVLNKSTGGVAAETIQPSTLRRRLLPLDGLRALSFGAVFLHHAFGVPGLWCGVDMFFVLSGYLITGILLRTLGRPGYFATFYRHRAFRIFPAYYAALAVSVLLLGSTVTDVVPWAATYTSNFHRAFYDQDGALTPLWSLAVEEQFYLAWPLVLFLCPAKHRGKMLAALAVAAPMSRVLAHLVIGRTAASTLPVCRMDGLVLGALVAYLASRGELQRLVRPALAALIPAGLIFAGAALVIPIKSLAFSVGVYEGSAIFFVLLLVVVVGEAMPWANHLLASRPLVYVGTISYGLYLLHMPVLFFFERHIEGQAAIGVAALAATFALAALSWRYFEHPLNLCRDRWFGLDLAAAAPRSYENSTRKSPT